MTDILSSSDLLRAKAFATREDVIAPAAEWILALVATVEELSGQLSAVLESEQFALADAACHKHEAEVAHTALGELYGLISTEIAKMHASRGDVA